MRSTNKDRRNLLCGCALVLPLLSLGCGGEDEAGSGSLTVLLEAEDTITEGLEAGDGSEDIRDGWAVRFDEYVATIGDIDLHLATDEDVEAEAADAFVVDLTQVTGSGLRLWEFDSLREGRWEFNYQTPGAGHGAERHRSVPTARYEEMVDNDYTYFIDGTMTKVDGQACPPETLAEPGDLESNGNTSGGNPCYDAPSVRFVFGAAAETRFGPCEIDEVPGVAISDGGSETVAVTIHGDHLFFNGFPEGGEGGVMRLAQWLADSDLNLDGTVTRDELERITPAELPELDPEVYQLGGAPIEPTNMYAYMRAQLKTQGHFQGEGECPVDGVAHEHGDEDEDEHGDEDE